MRSPLLALFLLQAVLLLAAPQASAEEWRAGELVLNNPWARIVPRAGGGNGAVFLEIANHGDDTDRLLATESPLAASAVLHGHSMHGGVAEMHRLEGVEIPPSGGVKLAPGGLHIMLLGIERPPAVGETFELTLIFAEAGRVTLQVPVRPLGATGP